MRSSMRKESKSRSVRKGRAVRNKRPTGCLGNFWSLIISCFGRQCTSQDKRCQDQENVQSELENDVANVKAGSTISDPQSLTAEVSRTSEFQYVTGNLSQKKDAEMADLEQEVTVIRDEPVNVSGSVENVKASSIVADELSLKVDILHLCQMECLIEELVLRNIAEIAYAQQALKKMQDQYSHVVEAKNMVDKVQSRILERIEVCEEAVNTVLDNNHSF